jgi:hypothetical protein
LFFLRAFLTRFIFWQCSNKFWAQLIQCKILLILGPIFYYNTPKILFSSPLFVRSCFVCFCFATIEILLLIFIYTHKYFFKGNRIKWPNFRFIQSKLISRVRLLF